MKKIRAVDYFLALIFSLPFVAATALGQAFTTVTAIGVTVDNGSGSPVHPPASSSLCFLGVDSTGAAITYTPSGGGPVSGPVCQTLNSSGNLTGGLQVANPALATPAGLRYTISVINGSTTYLTIPTAQFSGSAFVFTSYALPVNGHALGIGSPHLACNGGAAWTSTTYPPGSESFTCTLVSGTGQWLQYPQGGNYCPAGTGYLTPQGAPNGKGFCLPPVLAGIGVPSGSCVKSSTYYQQDAPGVTYACIADVWQLVAGGGVAGLTSFNGRSTAGATLQTPDIQGVLSNSPFGLSGSQGLMIDAASGTTSPSANWILGTGGSAGQLTGTKNFNLAATTGGSQVLVLRAADGSASFANGGFLITPSGVGQMAAGSTVNGSIICTTANGACPTSGAAFYQTSQNAGTSLTQRNKLNFLTATGITGTDDSGNGSTNLSLAAVPNSALANSAITINVTGSATGGGTIALGGSTTINVTGGGGGSIPGNINQQIYSAGTGNATASNATLDTSGNTINQSFNGTRRPDLYQTSPGSNDGIANALQSSGNIVIADQGYAATEAPSYSGFRAQLFISPHITPVPVPAWANNTHLFDRRPNSKGSFHFNIADNTVPPDDYDMTIVNNVFNGNINGEQFQPRVFGALIQCCGIPPTSGGTGLWAYFNETFIDNTVGISNLHFVNFFKNGTEDVHPFEIALHANGGTTAGSAEPAVPNRQNTQEDVNPFWGTVGTVAAGATVIPVTLGANSNWPGENKTFIDLSQFTFPVGISSVVPPNGITGEPGIYVTDQTWTPDTHCTLTNAVSIPATVKGITNTQTLTLTACTAPIVASTASTNKVCISDPVNGGESAFVTVGGTSTITANIRLSHIAGATVMQGPQACHKLSPFANFVNGVGGSEAYRNIIEIIGAKSAHELYYASRGTGGWQITPNGRFSTQNIPSGSTLTRVSNVVTMTLGTPDFLFMWAGVPISVVGSVDASFEGNFTVTQIDPSTLQWTNTGANATTTTTVNSYIIVNGQPSNAAFLYTGATIVEAQNPSTGVVDGTVVLEANDMHINSGDSVSSGPTDQNLIQSFKVIESQTSTPSPQLAVGVSDIVVNNPADGKILLHYVVNGLSGHSGCTDYVGCGGTRQPSTDFIQLGGIAIIRNFLSMAAPVNFGRLFWIQSCGMRQCTDPGSFFTETEFDAEDSSHNLGFYSTKWSNFNLTHLQEVVSNSTGDGTFVSMMPDLYQIKARDSSTTSELDFTVSGLSVSVPITSTVLAGTAPFVITSTTLNTNLNADMVGGVHLSGLCQSGGGGCPPNTPPITAATGSIGGGALLAGACTTGTATITGGTTGHTVGVSASDGTLPGSLGGGTGLFQVDAVVTNATTVTVEVCAAVAGTPAAKTYNISTY